eukprot:scaffold255813_cov27-Tisochrysis_lutea.AAC.4
MSGSATLSLFAPLSERNLPDARLPPPSLARPTATPPFIFKDSASAHARSASSSSWLEPGHTAFGDCATTRCCPSSRPSSHEGAPRPCACDCSSAQANEAS